MYIQHMLFLFVSIPEHGFVFQQGLMSFEEEQMDLALKALEETEKRCEVSDGFMKSIKKKFSKKKKDKVSKAGPNYY